MRNLLRLSFAYLRYYKKQTAALFCRNPVICGAADRSRFSFYEREGSCEGEREDRIRGLAL